MLKKYGAYFKEKTSNKSFRFLQLHKKRRAIEALQL